MKILFAPSEAKSALSGLTKLNKHSFFLSELFERRCYVIKQFDDFLKFSKLQELQKIFGIKKEEECLKLKDTNILDSFTCKAILRYKGVAYEYLKFETLEENSQKWIYDNLIIFSNLFGPIKASDDIPMYKFKQGSLIGEFKVDKFYKEHFSSSLDEYLKDEFIIDLRAGFYEKFYTIKKEYITMKFIKSGKVVSHWAKAYRGLVLRELSKYRPNSIEEVKKINFSNLKLKNIVKVKQKNEFIFEINN